MESREDFYRFDFAESTVWLSIISPNYLYRYTYIYKLVSAVKGILMVSMYF